MIKGCQKKIIHISNPRSPYFEEAYFVLKRGGENGSVCDADIIKEAMRIADEAVRPVKAKAKSARRARAAAAVMGAAAVSLIFGAVMLFYTVTA